MVSSFTQIMLSTQVGTTVNCIMTEAPPFSLHLQAVFPIIPVKTRFYNQSNAENNKKHLEFGKFSIKSAFFWKVLLPLHRKSNNLWKKMPY